MKKINIFIIAAVSFVTLAACAKISEIPVSESGDNNTGIVKLTGTFDSASPITRTVLTAENKVEWIAGDAITIFDGDSNVKATTSDSGATASFSASLTTTGPWYAVYPYYSKASISKSVISTTLPKDQKAVNGTFDDDLNIAVALSEDNHLAFKNVLGLVKFTVGKDNIKKVTLRGNNAEVLAGGITVDYNSGNPIWTETEGVRYITLAPASGTFANGGTYYFAVLPQTFSNGFSLNFENNAGVSFVVETTNEAVLTRSGILNIKTADGKITLEDNIVFADADVKADIVAAFDTDKDGELSYAEAAAVSFKALSAFTWTDKLTVDTFDELQYFTGLVTTTKRSDVPGGYDIRLPAIFEGCTNLTSVKLPRNLSTIAEKAFMNCSSLTSIELPNLRAIFGNTFNGSGLTSIAIPNSVASISNSAFEGCIALTGEVHIPNAVTSIGKNAFKGCTALVSVTLPENITTINEGTFQGCTELAGDVNIPNSVTEIGKNAFQGCEKITKIFFENSGTKLKTIGDSAFAGCTAMESFYLPSANIVESIGNNAFDGNKNMELRSRNLTHLKSIGQYAFRQTKIKNLTITSSELKTIPKNAFYQCRSLLNVYLSSSITSIGDFAFSGCIKLTGLSYVKDDTGIKLPEGFTTIGNYAFGGCELIKNVEFPSTITTIGDGIFRCETASSTVRHINLESWTIKATTVPTLGTDTFKAGTDKVAGTVASIKVPAESVESYKSADNWKAFAAVIDGF